jgi:hypothetical protein
MRKHGQKRVPRFLTLAAWLLTGPLRAEEASGVTVGDRVRIRAPGLSKTVLVGSVVSRQPNDLTLELAGSAEPLRVPYAEIEKLQVSRGQRRHGREGAVIGALASVALFAVAGGKRCYDGSGRVDCAGFGYDLDIGAGYVALAGVLSVGAGAAVGGLVGHQIETEDWRRVPRASLAVGPSRTAGGGGMVALRLSF